MSECTKSHGNGIILISVYVHVYFLFFSTFLVKNEILISILQKNDFKNIF
ncbi:hypothetical protein LEP1GSC008_1424 [Leptospira kirschneri serovar Bulgarica str. Nikolaevo]|uniref:Uncharacterized protein n=1 Tax=Leptospira kirschneri serovar Bulgarica str. Nikolaevo TaxID=1240687 RepID=M6FBA1_9LEPT|nr:hypothetical protein LEP1GSC008_1424 [Leptospira kirschneri serovar Bulgarica str. Nikolaevo]